MKRFWQFASCWSFLPQTFAQSVDILRWGGVTDARGAPLQRFHQVDVVTTGSGAAKARRIVMVVTNLRSLLQPGGRYTLEASAPLDFRPTAQRKRSILGWPRLPRVTHRWEWIGFEAGSDGDGREAAVVVSGKHHGCDTRGTLQLKKATVAGFCRSKGAMAWRVAQLQQGRNVYRKSCRKK